MATVEAAARFAHSTVESPSFVGQLAFDHLGAAPAGSGRGATPGRVAGVLRASELRASPDGEVVWRVPARDRPIAATVLADRGEWLGVRLGIGPYLVGWLPAAALRPAPGAPKQSRSPEALDPWARGSASPPTVRSGVLNPWRRGTRDEADPPDEEVSPTVPPGLPARLRAAAVRPVWRIRAGTRVHVAGVVVAVFRMPGHAVEIERRDGTVEVIASVDESVTVRGQVEPGALFAP